MLWRDGSALQGNPQSLYYESRLWRVFDRGFDEIRQYIFVMVRNFQIIKKAR